MKILLLILTAVFCANCVSQTSATKSEKVTTTSAQPSPTATNSNQIVVSELKPVSKEESDKIDETKQKEVEKLIGVPDELKKVDFENFKYPDVELKEGEFVIENQKDCDFQKYSLQGVYYVDLTNDNVKEAIAHLIYVTCGCGSCSGNHHSFYVYSIQKRRLKLLLDFQSGSMKYGNGLKSFIAKNKEITTEIFGICGEDKKEENPKCFGAFRAQNIHRKTFTFDGKKMKETSSEVIQTEPTDVMQYTSEIDINE